MKLLVIVVLVFLCFRSAAYTYEGRRADSILLNGVWEFAPGDGDEGDLAYQIVLLAHECQHVEQTRQHGVVPFLIRYMMPSERVEFEVHAFHVSMEMQMHLLNDCATADATVELLRKYYRLEDDDLGVAHVALRSAEKIARQGVVTHSVTRFAIDALKAAS